MLKKLAGVLLAIVGAFAIGGIALHRGEPINAMWIIVAAICVYLLGYRFYSAWIATACCRWTRPAQRRRSDSTTAATSCRRIAGSCSAITSPPSPDPVR